MWRSTGFFAFVALAIAAMLGGTLLASQNFQVRTRVDLVVVPVSVRDGDRVVPGLMQEDFTISEDGAPQTVANFSADPQPLSAAIVIDTGMGAASMRKVAPLFVALTSGFSAFDEMATFRFDHLVFKLADFTSDPAVIEKSVEIVNKLAETRPEQGDPGEPFAAGPPVLRNLFRNLKIGSNGAPKEPGAQSEPIPTSHGPEPDPVPTSHVLHDAVFEAAQALEMRPKTHRKIIVLISDGQLSGNTHSLDETTARLLQDDIQLYAVGLDFSLIEGRVGVLDSYAHATGGEVYNAATNNGIESAFNRITEQARNQYILGYFSSNKVAGILPEFRSIEVKTTNPKFKVTHRQGYLQSP